MVVDPFRSLADVADVVVVRGPAARQARPSLLLEVSHGATTALHFDRLRQQLHGDYPVWLRDFFFANTDVGAPELALRTAERLVAAEPTAAAAVVRCRIPRTFVDCNRALDGGERSPSSSAQLTPGLHAWVRDAKDKELLLARHAAYRDLVVAALAAVCGHGGLALFVHTYAPRSIDVPVDDRVVEHLRAAYSKERLPKWPLRPEVDLIADAPDGRCLASPLLLAAADRALARSGLQVARNATYPLHPSTLAHDHAVQHEGRTLCLEVRRDLLVPEFTPFAEMHVDAAKVDRVAAPLAAAVVEAMRSRARAG